MRELQLVGYTADLLHLVFTDAEEGGGRFKAPIDEDFVATLTEVLELVDPDAAPLGSLVQHRAPPSAAADEEAAVEADESRGNGDSPARAPRGVGPLAGMAAAEQATAVDNGNATASDRPRPSKLAPREIQALLRAGQGPRSVAKQADTDEWWVRRWLPPIEAERDQVLQEVWSSFVAKSRLGVSADPVGTAVEKNLTAKGVHEDDPSVEWSAARREGDVHWRVTLRYRSRGRSQRALWYFNPETGELQPRNSLAVDIAWTRPRGQGSGDGGRGGRSAGAPAPRKTAAKKASTKKTTGKKASTKKAAGTKPAGTNAAGTNAAGTNAAGTNAAGKKAAGKKTAGKKTAGKKTAGKKTAGKKTAGKKTAGKKTAGKKTAGKKTAGKKTAGKKTAGKKAAGKKAAGKKSPSSRR